MRFLWLFSRTPEREVEHTEYNIIDEKDDPMANFTPNPNLVSFFEHARDLIRAQDMTKCSRVEITLRWEEFDDGTMPNVDILVEGMNSESGPIDDDPNVTGKS